MKLFVATPSRDSQATGASRESLMHLVLSSPPFEIMYAVEQSDEDVVRSRSRYLRQFLATDATHILWSDADVAYPPTVVHRMMATGLPFVCCPYPKKRIDWTKITSYARSLMAVAAASAIEEVRKNIHANVADLVAQIPIGDLEAQGQAYPIHFLDGPWKYDGLTHTLGVAGCAIGCSIMSRACVEAMWKHYGQDPSLVFDDGRELDQETVALFGLICKDRDLLSEDLSICRRWREMNPANEVRLYLGPGAPAAHVGEYFFAGKLAAFGKVREA